MEISTNFHEFSKLNFSGFRPPNWGEYPFAFKLWFPTTELAQFFLMALCVSPLHGWHRALCARGRIVLWRHVHRLFLYYGQWSPPHPHTYWIKVAYKDWTKFGVVSILLLWTSTECDATVKWWGPPRENNNAKFYWYQTEILKSKPKKNKEVQTETNYTETKLGPPKNTEIRNTEVISGQKKVKIGPVTVRRPRLYGQTPPIQNLGTYFQKKAHGRALTRAHVHVTCM